MIDNDLAARFTRMEKGMPRLQHRFAAMTAAHGYFQNASVLPSVSVSDVQDDGSIEVTFQGVQIRFDLLPVFGADYSARGRVVCVLCHCLHGHDARYPLGDFTFGVEGETDLAPDSEGNFPRIDADAPTIILQFLDAAIGANKLI